VPDGGRCAVRLDLPKSYRSLPYAYSAKLRFTSSESPGEKPGVHAALVMARGGIYSHDFKGIVKISLIVTKSNIDEGSRIAFPV
jgi:hypothetical protein